MLHRAEGRTRELNALAARHARAVADAAGRRVLVAGSVGPTGDLFAPLGPLTEAEAVEVFVEQIEGLSEGGADLVWIETMSAMEEMRAAATAAGAGRHALHGDREFRHRRQHHDGICAGRHGARGGWRSPRRPHGFGCNCGVGASDLSGSVLAMTEAAPDAIVIAKANCGVPRVRGERRHLFGHAGGDGRIRAAGAGCRRAHHRRLLRHAPGAPAAMRQALEGHARGERPDVAQVVAAIGPLASPPARADATPRRAGRRRG